MKKQINNFVTLFILISLCIFTSCKKDSVVENLISTDNTLIVLGETDYRPNYHFTPALHWMNDPNGLVYYKGEYHLFYQYNPNGNTWGPMNWGHAVSTDLFNWQDLPIALSPDNLGTIFSGSAVVDASNTSGFRAGGEDPIVAIYTSAGAQQSQCIAYSIDKGRTWTKYANNPVLLNPGIPDFRDPKVSWLPEQNKWLMALSTGNKISFYSSPDLKNWTFESYFGEGIGAHGGVWECPDLFQLPVEGTNLKKWVLFVSINPGGPNGGSATQYFIGNFDGNKFTADSNTSSWIDFGSDNYAGVTYSNIPSIDGRRIMIGWMSNWNYAGQVPTTSWRSTNTVPRAITLVQKGSNFVLRFNPVTELSSYINKTVTIPTQKLNALELTNNDIVKTGSYQLSFKADFTQLDTLKLTTGNIAERMSIIFDKKYGNVTIDRSRSGVVNFNNVFANSSIYQSFTIGADNKLDVRMLVDKTSIELFWNNGEGVMTTLFFPTYQYNFIRIEGGKLLPQITDFSLSGLNKSLLR